MQKFILNYIQLVVNNKALINILMKFPIKAKKKTT